MKEQKGNENKNGEKRADEKVKDGQAGEGGGEAGLTALDKDSVEALLAGEKMEQFQKVMNHIIGRAMEENSEKLSQDISYLVHDKLMKEMEYLMRVSDEREEERFKQLDEVIRAYQRDNQGRAEAAASVTGFPFSALKRKNSAETETSFDLFLLRPIIEGGDLCVRRTGYRWSVL